MSDVTSGDMRLSNLSNVTGVSSNTLSDHDKSDSSSARSMRDFTIKAFKTGDQSMEVSENSGGNLTVGDTFWVHLMPADDVTMRPSGVRVDVWQQSVWVQSDAAFEWTGLANCQPTGNRTFDISTFLEDTLAAEFEVTGVGTVVGSLEWDDNNYSGAAPDGQAHFNAGNADFPAPQIACSAGPNANEITITLVNAGAGGPYQVERNADDDPTVFDGWHEVDDSPLSEGDFSWVDDGDSIVPQLNEDYEYGYRIIDDSGTMSNEVFCSP